jgi:hypothetical protein
MLHHLVAFDDTHPVPGSAWLRLGSVNHGTRFFAWGRAKPLVCRFCYSF